MRIGTSVPLPLPLPPAPSQASLAAQIPAGPNRAALLQLASLVASTSWPTASAAPAAGSPTLPAATPMPTPMLTPTPTLVRGTTATPGGLPMPGALPVLAGGIGQAAAAALTTPAVPGAMPTPALTAPGAPLPPPLPVLTPAPVHGAAPNLAAAALLPAATRLLADRLTLSPATQALRVEVDPGIDRPTSDFTLNLLGALTGEPRSRMQLLSLGPQTAALPTLPAGNTGRGPTDVLQVLVHAVLHGSDAKLVDLTLGLSLQRQGGGAAPIDARALEVIRSTLEQLAKTEIDLDYPGLSSALAGQSARFQAVLDPLALWPLQSFLLSGLLILGRARDADDIDALAEDDEALARDESPTDHDEEQTSDQPPGQPAETARVEEPTPLPDDGGLPIISASQWLELELRHWRLQVRQWMALPAL